MLESMTQTNDENGMILYEHPLDERIRMFMRLEQMVNRLLSSIEETDIWQAHYAISIIIDLINLLNRVDLKNELLLELGRIDNTNDVGPTIRQQREHLREALLRQTRRGAGDLLDIELLASLRQRFTLPGGACPFDLTQYQYWLSRPASERQSTLREWSKPFNTIYKACQWILETIRARGHTETLSVQQGFFQRQLPVDTIYRIIQIQLPRQIAIYPEFSAGKQRLTVRFMDQENINQHPTQTQHDISCLLRLC